jgi:hypothetical protein
MVPHDAVSVTLPPAGSIWALLPVSEQVEFVVGVLQVTVMLPPEAIAWNVALVQVRESADAGSASATLESATAAASTRRVNRFVCISFTSKKLRRYAAMCKARLIPLS